jgi:hypothetical protein
MPASDFEAAVACAYVVERVRRAAGPRWLQGARTPPLPCRAALPAVRLVAERRLHKVEEAVARGLVAWAEGTRPVDLLTRVPTAREVLALQARGRRCVSLLADGADASPHADGLAFCLHDLCHLEKFVDPEHHRGQVGFFGLLDAARCSAGWAEHERDFDAAWQRDLDHVAADMNGSAIFLFAALKMKLKMAVRRAVARRRGVAESRGPLDAEEIRVYEARLERLLALMGLRGAIADDARTVSTRRDARDAAARLLAHFEQSPISFRVEAEEPRAPFTPPRS